MPALDLEQLEGVVDSLQNRHMAVMPERCTRQRHRLSACSRCQDACPVGAITCPPGGGPQVDWDLCQRCGACATVCPTSALEARSPDNDEIWGQVQRAAQEHGWVGFACSRAGVAGESVPGLVRTTCLARLDESLLLAGPAHGAGAVWLVAGQCDACPLGAARAVIDGVVGRTNALLLALGRQPCVHLRPELPPELASPAAPRAGGSGVSRRGLFKTLARETAKLNEASAQARSGRQQPPRPAAGCGLSTALPEKRLMLVGELERLLAARPAGQPGDRPESVPFQAGEDGLWAGLRFTADCTACQMCAFFCPTGALIKADSEGRVGVVYQVSRCVNCLLCRDVCYRQAVLALGEVDFQEIMDGSGKLLCVRQGSAAPWQAAAQEKTARAILDMLAE